jgi:hypothetical protein
MRFRTQIKRIEQIYSDFYLCEGDFKSPIHERRISNPPKPNDKGSPELTARFCNDAEVRRRLRQGFVMMTKVRRSLRQGFVTTQKFAGAYGKVL